MNIARALLTLTVLLNLASALAMADPPTPAPAAAPPASITGVDKQDLFEARTAGYTLYRIPGILVTGRGTILAWCEARKAKGWDWDPIDVLLRRSTDGGRTWDAARPIAIAPADAVYNPAAISHKLGGVGVTLNNPVLIAGPDSTVHFLYCVNYARCFYRRSNDDGQTFSPPIEITATFDKFRPEYNWQVIGPGPGHGIRLSSGPHEGRLIVPTWLSLGTGNNGHHPDWTATVFSDDDGKTWARGDFFARSTPDIIDPSETVAVQLSDGRVMVNSRTDTPGKRRLVTISPDGATHWSNPAYDPALFDPVCFASMIRLPGAPNGPKQGRLVFCNPNSETKSNGKSVMKPRRNLTLRLSEDDGKTWPISKVLDPGTAGYSDLAAGADGTIYCLYERGGIKDMFDTGFLTLARIAPGWLTGGGKKASQ
jgi:sialidase-1